MSPEENPYPLNTTNRSTDDKYPLTNVPELANFDVSMLEDGELEVVINAGQDLNQLFAELNEQEISVVSLRNKANRLEEFFIDMVEQKQAGLASAGP